MNREFYIGKKMFINSTGYYNGELFETAMSICDGVTEDLSQFRFSSPKSQMYMNLGCCYTRNKDHVFINKETIEKYILASVNKSNKKIDKYCMLFNPDNLSIELNGVSFNKDKFTGEKFYGLYKPMFNGEIRIPIREKGNFKYGNCILEYNLYDDINDAILKIVELISTYSDFNFIEDESTQEFKLPVEWAVYSTIKIKAKSLEEALKIAKETLEDIPLPTESNYIDGSFILGKADDNSSEEEDLEYYETFN